MVALKPGQPSRTGRQVPVASTPPAAPSVSGIKGRHLLGLSRHERLLTLLQSQGSRRKVLKCKHELINIVLDLHSQFY